MRETGPLRKQTDTDGGGPADAAAPYIGLARTLLGQLKNRMKQGGLAQLARSYTLPDGTEIRVASSHGQDAVRIQVPPHVAVANAQALEAVGVPPPELFTPPQDELPPIPLPDEKHLLVIFNNTQIVAIPMSALRGAHWPVVYKAKLKQGLSQWVEVAQYNFGVPGCDSVFLAPFSLQAPDFAQDVSLYWLNTVRAHNTGPHAVKALQTTVPAFRDPILGASGSTIWTQDGAYTAIGGAPVLQRRSGGQPRPRGIGSDGTYYYAAGAVRATLGVGLNASWDGSSPFLGSCSFTFDGGTPSNVDLSHVIPSTRTNNNLAGSWSVTGTPDNGAADTHAVGEAIDDGLPRDYSIAIPLPVYQRNGSTDRFDAQAIQVTASLTRTSGFTGGPGTDAFDIIRGGQSIPSWAETFFWESFFGGPSSAHPNQWNYVTSETGIDFVQYSTFPPALGTDQVYAAVSSADGSVSLNVTPYFSVPGSGPLGWMHLSNGQHCMQAFWITDDNPDNTPFLYLNGKNVQPQLEAAIGTSLANVQAMVMDLPLALIRAMT